LPTPARLILDLLPEIGKTDWSCLTRYWQEGRQSQIRTLTHFTAVCQQEGLEMGPSGGSWLSKFSDTQLVETLVQHGFDRGGGPAIGFKVAADGIGDVAASRVE
jgi:hypothetical protein